MAVRVVYHVLGLERVLPVQIAGKVSSDAPGIPEESAGVRNTGPVSAKSLMMRGHKYKSTFVPIC